MEGMQVEGAVSDGMDTVSGEQMSDAEKPELERLAYERWEIANARIRELEAERDIYKETAASGVEADIWKEVSARIDDIVKNQIPNIRQLELSHAWLKQRAEKAEAERGQFEGELRISQAAVGHNMGVAKRIEAATIERCAQVCDPVESSYPPSWTAEVIERYNAALRWCAAAIRALKPSGQPEKPVNPYLLGGSSTQSEG